MSQISGKCRSGITPGTWEPSLDRKDHSTDGPLLGLKIHHCVRQNPCYFAKSGATLALSSAALGFWPNLTRSPSKRRTRLQRLTVGQYNNIPLELVRQCKSTGLILDVDGVALTSVAATFRVTARPVTPRLGPHRIEQAMNIDECTRYSARCHECEVEGRILQELHGFSNQKIVRTRRSIGCKQVQATLLRQAKDIQDVIFASEQNLG